MPSIKLQSSDGQVFTVAVEVVRKSITIKTMLEDLGMDVQAVPILEVNAADLKQVIEWVTHHNDDPTPTPTISCIYPGYQGTPGCLLQEDVSENYGL